MWVEPDCNIPSGESFIRQFLYGKAFFREEFEVENTVAWLLDSFGFSGALPQILIGCGVPYFFTTKLSWSVSVTFPHHTFWWQGIDGSRVLAHQTPMFGSGDDAQLEWLIKGDRSNRDRGRVDTWCYPFGYGDGGGGPTPAMLEVVRRVENLEGAPRVTLGTASEWFTQLVAAAQDLSIWVGELPLDRHRGTLTTQAETKKENRRCEVLLHDAEFLAAFYAGDYPTQALEEAWKLVLLNQFHDILPGSSITHVYEDAHRDYARVHEITEGIIADCLARLGAEIDTHEYHHPVLVVNTLGMERDREVVAVPIDTDEPLKVCGTNTPYQQGQIVERDGKRELLFEVSLSEMNYTVIDLVPGEPPEDNDAARATAMTLENQYLRIEVNEFGGLVSIYDKAQGREVLPPGAVGNMFQRFDEHGSNAWEVEPYADEMREELTALATITVVENGPVRAALRVERQLTPRAHLVQEIRLTRSGRRIDFVTRIDWREDQALLKVAFPVNIHADSADFDIQFGHQSRPTHRNTPWDQVCYETIGHKWAELSEGNYGVALLNDGKYGYDVHGNVLRLSLLRATTSPDPWADRGVHTFTYSLLPHFYTDRPYIAAIHEGSALNMPLYAHQLSIHDGRCRAGKYEFQYHK